SLCCPSVGHQARRNAVERVRLWNPWSDREPWMRTHRVRMYLLGSGSHWLAPPARFVIVTPGRSGSELLTDLLNSHPQITCDAEILRDRTARPELFVAGRAAKAGLSGARAYGFKIHCGHFGYQFLREHPGYLRQAAATGATLLFLRRRNLLAQAVSSTIARQTRWHWRKQDAPVFTAPELDPVEILMMAYLFEESDAYLASLLSPLPHDTYVYESDLLEPARQRATVQQICAGLGVDEAPTRSDHVRFTPPALADTIANWDAVAELIGSTRFARFLDSSNERPGLDCPAPTPATATEKTV
ncbi:MAG: hypothetical protein ACRDZ8_04610, partial [Acidimicrobiales bacterium]